MSRDEETNDNTPIPDAYNEGELEAKCFVTAEGMHNADLLQNFEDFIEPGFKFNGRKEKKGTDRTRFVDPLLKLSLAYVEQKIEDTSRSLNISICPELMTETKKFAMFSISTQKHFSKEYCDRLVHLIFLGRMDREIVDMEKKPKMKRKDHELEPTPTFPGFIAKKTIPDILQKPLDPNSISSKMDSTSLVQNVLFPILKHVIFPETPFRLRSALTWRQNVTRLINFSICSVLLLKYKSHEDFHSLFKEYLNKNFSLPPWWCVQCFYNLYELKGQKNTRKLLTDVKMEEKTTTEESYAEHNKDGATNHDTNIETTTESNDDENAASESSNTDNNDTNANTNNDDASINREGKSPTPSVLDLDALEITQSNSNSLSQIIQREYELIHQILYAEINEGQDKIYAAEEALKPPKPELKMKRPPAYNDVNEFMWKFRKCMETGIFDEGWLIPEKHDSDEFNFKSKDLKNKKCFCIMKSQNEGDEKLAQARTTARVDVDVLDYDESSFTDGKKPTDLDVFLTDTANEGIHRYEYEIIQTVFDAKLHERCVNYKRIAKAQYFK
ncbi:predicted protein [Chaetoceros tenuissimus]|uniref:Uncharacterized protein n=1 Tax=Chaetoceros tenuissimus TaxID=426638 RepID=A0AAD3HAL3_9STRA|nr:predicted protein [Chaetoceros tenuissimus]